MSSWLISALNVPLLFVAGAVGLLSGWKVYDLWRQGECSERMWLIWGIGFAWAGTSLHTLWWMVWRIGGSLEIDTDWMNDHPVVVVFKLMIVAGGLLHLRTFTWEWPWPDWMRVPWWVVERVIERVFARRRRLK